VECDFGKLLRTIRTRRGLTQRQLADLSTVSVRAIRDLESGRANRPRTDTVRLIADGLGLRGTARSEFESASRVEAPAGMAELPAPLGFMLGRDTERAELRALLASGTQRLVTLTGLAGVGKTRLAVDVAATLRDTAGLTAVWCTDPGAIAGVDERPAVLVLDGIEAGTPLDEVVALLHRRGRLRVLCTARSPLAVPGERVVPLGPLPVPATTEAEPDTLAHVPAVGLLLHHVAQVRPGFRLTATNAAAVAGIASWLAGVPALLEAAAGWFLVYEPDELLSYLRCDPEGFMTGSQWRDTVWQAVDQLDATGLTVLSALAEHAAPVTDLVARTGLRLSACVAALGRLVLLGLATSSGSPGRFHVLEPVRTVWTGSPEKTAAVLPLRLPVPAARAG
jgi:transcriptional regulator with XRE-family HTH domain